MLSEVPWMKFKVIAEPDLTVFGSHPVVKQTLTSIAESTVEHVALEMHKMLTIAMEEAIVVVTASAMKHVSLQMEHDVRDAVGYAAASPSMTEAEYLRIAKGLSYGAYGGGVYAVGGGYAAGGGYAGGAIGISQVNGTVIGAVDSAQSNSVSTESYSESKNASSSESYSSETNTASAASATTAIATAAQAESMLVSAQA